MKNVVNENKNNKISIRDWFIFIIIGLAGQFAWAIENMYLNSYITYLNFTSTDGGFDYSLMIAITTALSAVVATLTTLFMGTLTDKINKRKIFIALGYVLWGVSTASFGFLNVNSDSSLFAISMTASNAAILVIVIDCFMTFLGSTSNDAAFNSYVTRNSTEKNRAKIEGVLSILPLIAMLIIFVGLNGLTTKESGYRWDLFFFIVGGLVTLVGIIAFFLIPKEKDDKPLEQNYSKLIFEGFKVKTIKENKELYLILLIYFIYSVAIQVYFPYLMVYIERTCQIPNSGSSFLTPFAIVMAVALLIGSVLSVLVGFIADKIGKEKMIIPIIGILIVGLIMMFCVPFVKNESARIAYCAISGLIMILGYVSVPTILNAIIRGAIPKGKEGTFMGIRMIFVVALPMCIGPFIGDALNKAFGQLYTGEYGVQNYLPSNYNYIVSLVILLIAVALLVTLFILRKRKSHE